MNPEQQSGERELVIEIDVPKGSSDEEITRCVLGLVKETDRLFRAYGGHGLKVKDVKVKGLNALVVVLESPNNQHKRDEA